MTNHGIRVTTLFALSTLMLSSTFLIVGSYAFSSTASPLPSMAFPPPRAVSSGSTTYPGQCKSPTMCSEGLTDYGINGSQTYSYTAQSVHSTTTFTKLELGNKTGMQLNSVAYGVISGGNTGEYWIQDDVEILQDGSIFTISFLNNIWNFSSSGSPGIGSLVGPIQGCGRIVDSEYYGCSYQGNYAVTLPFKIVLKETGTRATYLQTDKVASCIQFYFGVYEGTTLKSGTNPSKPWDTACFLTTKNVGSAPYFVVGGFNPVEWNALQSVLCGWGYGYNGEFVAIKAQITLEYQAVGSRTWESVPHAWSEGSTGESATGVHMSGNITTHTGEANNGTDDQVQLF
jgi:hypothetical protein